MAINLEKNKQALIAAWKDVLDEKTETNWYVSNLSFGDLLHEEIK